MSLSSMAMRPRVGYRRVACRPTSGSLRAWARGPALRSTRWPPRSTAPRAVAVAAARAVLAERRAELLAGARPTTADLARARPRVGRRRAERPSLRRVLNATGVIVHTNLGRAPLAAAAREAVGARRPRATRTSSSTSARGERGSRHDHVEGLLRELTGAEAALVVNNCAGAVAARGRGAGRAGPRGDRLARPAGRDRRRLPDPRRDRAGRRAAGRGRHDQPHAPRRLRARDRARTRARSCARTRRTSASSASSRRWRSRSCASSACR